MAQTVMSVQDETLARFDRAHGIDREVTITGIRLPFRTIFTLVFAVCAAQLIIFGVPFLIYLWATRG